MVLHTKTNTKYNTDKYALEKILKNLFVDKYKSTFRLKKLFNILV